MITKRKDLVLINEIREYVVENVDQEISIPALCHKFGMNRTKLQEGFIQQFGSPLYAFVSRIRMEKACSLLTATDEPVKVIAAACGFRSTSGFTRAFTKAHDVSPTQYRQQMMT